MTGGEMKGRREGGLVGWKEEGEREGEFRTEVKEAGGREGLRKGRETWEAIEGDMGGATPTHRSLHT